MKIRVGFGLGTRSFTNDHSTFDPFVDSLEELGFDSLWLSERLGGECPDPIVGLAYAAGRTQKMKFGFSVMVLPGRNLAVLAKELASLDRLSNGRLLPAFGLGVADVHEQAAFGVQRKERAKMFNEALPLLKRMWEDGPVTHQGEFYNYEEVDLLPKPTQKPMDIWLGGAADVELRRCGRFGDGWLPSFCTPEMAADGWKVVNEAADEHERFMDPEHFGVLVPYSHGELPDSYRTILDRRAPGIDPQEIIPIGHKGLKEQLERFIEVGASKFVPILVGEPENWFAELEGVAEAVLPIQN
ncbi:MAG: LLM class flavin-dependent oxidoreductase [Acidimicrobiales bacterium]|jgi:probable F420-dependent oxidoreductase|nr:LLM class flavin-dependent oxidoreductase [Acidimicrobiales bacterium]MEC9114988.1 LLM class flavin-dependent oxidoreductase [Actinomycetota bacterium]MEE2680015.1 LLM class flavin-dependent oxidoreductase [Actinomycetota bacterium]|tara:strand:- start:115 stop:1011 length:897 start_codon:yes stop_codon:yes gene_type:complete